VIVIDVTFAGTVKELEELPVDQVWVTALAGDAVTVATRKMAKEPKIAIPEVTIPLTETPDLISLASPIKRSLSALKIFNRRSFIRP
jgi:hypothetical protein